MSDSNVRDELAAKHERNREQRLDAVRRWAKYIKTTPVEEWGAEQNAVVNDQLEAAQHADLPAEHLQRVRDVAAEIADVQPD